MLRLSWSQPEDLLPHALVQAELDGRAVADIRERWVPAGGSALAPVGGATPAAAPPALRELARALLVEIDGRPLPASLLEAEPSDLARILALTGQPFALSPAEPDLAAPDLADRVHGAWLGRAAGCLLGKPVEKISREGIRAIARSTGNWPIASYFTARGLDPEIAERHPWNRRSRPTSLLENIDGMPEDDDLNFALIALRLLETHGHELSTDDVAQAWLNDLPGGRVFTAERIAYRNLLDGYEPEVAGRMGNPFQDWIGAQIRTDVYGWATLDTGLAARLAWQDGRLSHSRNGLYGAMFVAVASAAALLADSVADVIDAGLSVVPPESRYSAAIRRGVALGASEIGLEAALDALHAEYGRLHWVHVLNNAALLAFALTRSGGDFAQAVAIAVAGGWDTDSVGATAGAICGALAGASALPEPWIAPLRNRLASSVPGCDGIGFDQLARRTLALAAELGGAA